MCYVVLLGGSMILAPHIVLCALRTTLYVTYLRPWRYIGGSKVGFSRTDRLHRL
jgi:hypothetical protein